MKKRNIIITFIICLLVIPSYGLFSETTTILINRAENGNAFSWEIEKDSDNIIKRVVKKILKTGEVTEQIIVHRDGEKINTTYIAGNYKLTQELVVGDNNVVSNYNEVNSYLKTSKNGIQKIQLTNDVYENYLNGVLKGTFNYKEKWLKNSTGEYILRMKSNSIMSNDGTIINISKKSSSLILTFKNNPQILPPDVYTFSSNFIGLGEQNIMINYFILPYEIQFLLLL